MRFFAPNRTARECKAISLHWVVLVMISAAGQTVALAQQSDDLQKNSHFQGMVCQLEMSRLAGTVQDRANLKERCDSLRATLSRSVARSEAQAAVPVSPIISCLTAHVDNGTSEPNSKSLANCLAQKQLAADVSVAVPYHAVCESLVTQLSGDLATKSNERAKCDEAKRRNAVVRVVPVSSEIESAPFFSCFDSMKRNGEIISEKSYSLCLRRTLSTVPSNDSNRLFLFPKTPPRN